ncbi:hypothetical protein LTR09_006013 [Extremus antarcticus]|uniref:Non-haem dioxygenase N-terminal domain-containing protein n=1 Tax=Extremus antarcticus TaxID=702011 RepID=A0AAJ0DMC9_9PEZI|nr:hypothetical protein LTR09_006013 [Extremus antarcticus]
MANLTSYQSIPSTTASLDWADLIAIDLSLFDQPGGKQLLAAQLKHAISTVGFFYVPNSGLSEAEVNEQFALAAQLFSLPDEGKQQYRVDPSKQGFFGWEPRGSRKQQHRLVDSLELYDDPKWNDIFNAEYARPPPLAAAAKKCEAFQRHLHNHVLRRLLVLSAIIMELDDEEQLWRLHSYPSRSQCHLRYLLYHPRTPAELATIREHGIEHNVYGHTDFGTFTLLMRQPVAALQVRPAGEEEWKNNRVVLPPEDQRGLRRYGVIYFSGPDDGTLLEPVESPLLAREKVEGNANRSMPPAGVTAGEWVDVRFRSIDANYANNKDNKVTLKSVEVASYA